MSSNNEKDDIFGTILKVAGAAAGAAAVGWLALEESKARGIKKREVEEEVDQLLSKSNGAYKILKDKVYLMSDSEWEIWEKVLNEKASESRFAGNLLVQAHKTRKTVKKVKKLPLEDA